MSRRPPIRSRAHAAKARLVDRLPRGLRPKLPADQVRDLSMAHHVNLDAIHRAEANTDILWQYVGGVLTWMRVAEELGVGHAEMLEQHELALRLVARSVRLGGRPHFAAGEYETARRGVIVMDMLAERVDRRTALAAATWAEIRVQQLEHQAAVAA